MTAAEVTAVIDELVAQEMLPVLVYDADLIASLIDEVAIAAAVDANYANDVTIIWDQISDVASLNGKTYTADEWKNIMIADGWYSSGPIVMILRDGMCAEIQGFNPGTSLPFVDDTEALQWMSDNIAQRKLDDIEAMKCSQVVQEYLKNA